MTIPRRDLLRQSEVLERRTMGRERGHIWAGGPRDDRAQKRWWVKGVRLPSADRPGPSEAVGLFYPQQDTLILNYLRPSEPCNFYPCFPVLPLSLALYPRAGFHVPKIKAKGTI